jgi:hypothetical protein
MHDAWLIAVPTLLILAGIFFNNSVAKDLRSEMKDLRSEMKDFRSEVKGELRELRTEMKTRFDLVDAELRYFHGAVGKLDGRVDALEKRGG